MIATLILSILFFLLGVALFIVAWIISGQCKKLLVDAKSFLDEANHALQEKK